MVGSQAHTMPVHIVGRKNSGKTTLICELVQELCARGYRVGTIKHTSHSHEFDTSGKDSQVHRVAGAVVAGIISPGLCAAFWPTPTTPIEEDRYALLLKLYDDCDLVLIEGDTLTSAPKIEVWRSTTDGIPFANSGIEVSGLVTDEPVACRVPVWPRSDVAGLVWRVLDLAGMDVRTTSLIEEMSISSRDLTSLTGSAAYHGKH